MGLHVILPNEGALLRRLGVGLEQEIEGPLILYLEALNERA